MEANLRVHLTILKEGLRGAYLIDGRLDYDEDVLRRDITAFDHRLELWGMSGLRPDRDLFFVINTDMVTPDMLREGKALYVHTTGTDCPCVACTGGPAWRDFLTKILGYVPCPEVGPQHSYYCWFSLFARTDSGEMVHVLSLKCRSREFFRAQYKVYSKWSGPLRRHGYRLYARQSCDKWYDMLTGLPEKP